MAHPLDAALADPWEALRVVVGEPLHPGGANATEDLLDRAGVGAGTRLLDVGCGAGNAIALAQDRGAQAVGLDRQARDLGTIQGDLEALPVRSSSVDVVLAECVLCLATDVERAATEVRRVLATDGRLALSDVVVDGDLRDRPAPIDRLLCLDGSRSRHDLHRTLTRAGFEVGVLADHRDDLLTMRDRAANRVDYERLLPAFGERGRELLQGLEELEAGIESGRVGYVSLVARARD